MGSVETVDIYTEEKQDIEDLILLSIEGGWVFLRVWCISSLSPCPIIVIYESKLSHFLLFEWGR